MFIEEYENIHFLFYCINSIKTMKRFYSSNRQSEISNSFRKRVANLSKEISPERYFRVDGNFKNIKEIETWVIENLDNSYKFDKMDHLLKDLEKQNTKEQTLYVLKRIDSCLDSFHTYGMLICINIGIITFLLADK